MPGVCIFIVTKLEYLLTDVYHWNSYDTIEIYEIHVYLNISVKVNSGDSKCESQPLWQSYEKIHMLISQSLRQQDHEGYTKDRMIDVNNSI